MKTFSIAELEQYTLLKSHTLRIWEHRFGIIKPERTKTNIRYYSVEELGLLLDLALLSRQGVKISVLAALDKNSIKQKVHELKGESERLEQKLNSLIVCMFQLNIEDFELILDSAIANWGIHRTVESLILPFIDRVGLYSYYGKSGIEYHFVTAVLRRKLILAIEQTHTKESIFKSVLLFLPEGEHYDLLLLYLSYHLRQKGMNVLYLGTNISADNLQQVIKRKKPHAIVGYVANQNKAILKNIRAYVTPEFESSLLLTGATLHPPALLPAEINYLPFYEATKAVLALTQKTNELVEI